VNKRILKRVGIAIGALVVVGVFAAVAAAVLTSDAGGAQVRVDNRTNNVPSSTNATVFNDLPGGNVVVSVPANQSRLYHVTFSGETRCFGAGGGGWCSIRIIATNTVSAASVELNPVAGLDYAFDSDASGAADDLWEGHSMDRTRRLAGGPNGASYRIRVQRAVTNNTITFSLDDWNMMVQTNL
jgi:hypothetical protein